MGARAGSNYPFLTQKERDNETGLDYFGARYYASTQGRFISADSFRGRLTNPQSLNRYSYVLNNPLKLIDPSGHQGELPRKKGKRGNDEEFLNTEDTPEVVVINSEPCKCAPPIPTSHPSPTPASAGIPGTPSTFWPHVRTGVNVLGDWIFHSGYPGYDENFAHQYQSGMARDLAPPGRQTGIFFPFLGGGFTRALTAEDLGVVGTVQALEGTFTLTEEGVAVVHIEYIQGEINNPFSIIENVSNTARAQGATILRIEGTLGNERLYNVLVQRYGMTTEGAKDVITIPLKRDHMNVRSRVHRTLEHLSNYREIALDDAKLLDGIPLEEGEECYGFYENPPDPDSEIIAVTNLGLHLKNKGVWLFWAYAEMESVGPAPRKEDAEALAIKLRRGGNVLIPVRGRQGRFRDVFEFIRFLDRVKK